MRGRTYWHSGGVKCQHAAEGRQRTVIGQMSMWLIHDKILCFFFFFLKKPQNQIRGERWSLILQSYASNVSFSVFAHLRFIHILTPVSSGHQRVHASSKNVNARTQKYRWASLLIHAREASKSIKPSSEIRCEICPTSTPPPPPRGATPSPPLGPPWPPHPPPPGALHRCI